MVARTGRNRPPTQLTGFMPYISPMKTTVPLLVSSKEKLSAQPMGDKTGVCTLAGQPGCLASISQMPTQERSLATMERYQERQKAAKAGLRKQAEQLISCEQFGSQTPTQAQL